MMLDKILILDDKLENQDYSSFQALSLLSEEQRKYIEYFEETLSLWCPIDNGDDVKLLKDFSCYKFILIHYSFNDPIIGEELMGSLINKLSETSRVVLFSGNRLESEIPIEKRFDEKESKHSHFEIRRVQYFNNLNNFIDSFLLNKVFQIRYLYNPYINPKKDKAYKLLEIIKINLEESIQSAIESDSFNELLSLFGYEKNSEISNRFSKMTDDDFIENIEDLIENN